MSERSRPRPAATLVILRDSEFGLEVLLTQRPNSMRFMAGMTVFPGGAVAETDRDERWTELSTLTLDDAADLFPKTTGAEALAAAVCALRESHEEVGFSLTGALPEHLRRAGPEDFLGSLAATGQRLPTDRLVAAGRWVTPEQLPLRFDTWFFVTSAPQDWEPEPQPGEVERAWWSTPKAALDQVRRGDAGMAPPTIEMIQRLSAYETSAEALEGMEVVEANAGAAIASRLSPSAAFLLAPNPGVMTGPGTNTYIIASHPAFVIDPAVDDEAYLRELIDAAGELEAILITHRHPDHTGGVAALVQATGAEVRAYGDAPVDGIEVRPVSDGESMGAGSLSLVAMHTPGHSPDHLCFYLSETGELIAGDNVLGQGTSVIAPPEGDMDDYLDSLHRMLELAPTSLYPGHFSPPDDPVGMIETYIAHRHERESKVLDAIRQGAVTLDEVVREAYSDTPSQLHPIARGSALAHLVRLDRGGVIAAIEGGWIPVSR